MLYFRKSLLILSIILLCLSIAAAESKISTENQISAANVPADEGTPVLTDGIFTPGEWDDAKKIKINDTITLLVKQYMGIFYLGIYCPDLRMPVSDLFISSEEGDIYQFHISAQLGEIKLNPEGEKDPEFEYGNTSGWYGNEIRWNYGKAQELQQQGKTNTEAQLATIFPHEGHEYMFRLAKFNSSRTLKIRLELLYSGHWDNPTVYPEGTKNKDLTGWLELKF